MFNIPTVTVAKTTLTGTSSSVTLTYVAPSVAWTPRHLVVRVNGKSNYSSYDRDNIEFQFNGDTGSNYNYQYLSGVGTSANCARYSAQTKLYVGQTSGDDANWFGGGDVLIPDALSTRTHKSVIAFSGSNEDIVQTVAGRWASTAAITSVTISATNASWLTGSTFELCVVDESFNIDQDGDGEQILGSNGTFTVSSIGAANGDLVLIGNVRGDVASQITGGLVQLNGDTTTTNYYRQRLRGNNTTVEAYAGGDNAFFDPAPGNSADANAFGAWVGQFANYSDGSNDRVAITQTGFHGNSSNSHSTVHVGRWNNTAAITSIAIPPSTGTNWLTGSMLSTYVVPKNLIGRQELGSNATTVTFSSIPQTYDHLELSIYARGTSAGVPTRGIVIDVNADSTTANYIAQILYGQGTGAAAYQSATRGTTSIPSGTATANIFGQSTSTFYNYTKTDRYKHYLTMGGIDFSNIALISHRWISTAAISSLVLKVNVNDYLAGSVFELRGIHADTTAAAPSDIEKLNGIASADIEAVN